MPKLIYEKILGEPLLYINMHLQLTDQSLCYPKGVLEDVIVRVGQSYVPGNRWRCKGTHHLGPTLPKHNESHHLRGQCQDLLHN
jgi:hypothetical protein